MRRFEVFYTDGSMFEGSSNNDWAGAPVEGVQAIIFLHDDGSAREKVYGFDEYTLRSDGRIEGADHRLYGFVKKGELIPDDEFRNLLDSLERRSRIWNF